MFQNIRCHVVDATRIAQCLFSFYVPHLAVFHIFLFLHGANIVHTEGQYVVVADSVDDGVGMQSFAKGILCRFDKSYTCWHILYKDRCTRKSEDVVFLKLLRDGCMHIAKLAAVALVENQYHFFLVDVAVGVLLDKARQLLYGSNDDFALAVGYLFLQDACRSIAVGCTLLESVILSHGLIVQVLSIHHEHDLVDIWQLCSKLGSLKRSQSLT